MSAAAMLPTGLRNTVKLILLALSYFAGAQLGFAFSTPYDAITLFWLPSGIAVAALLRCGKSCLPGIFAGALMSDLSLGHTLLLSIGLSTGMTLAPLLAVWLLRRWQFEPTFAKQRDLWALISAAALGMLLSATCGVALLWLSGELPASDVPPAWLHWWLGDSMGVLLAAPLLLSFTPETRNQVLHHPGESLLCLLLLGTVGWLVFFVDYGDHALPLAFLPMPLLIWAALRKGITGTSLAVLLLSALMTIGTAQGKGVFGVMPGNEAMYLAWLYMFTIVLTGLMVTTMLGERRTIEHALQRTNELLALAQREARAGVWSWDIASGKFVWSDELFHLFGLFPDAAKASFDTWRSIVHPQDLQAAEEKIGVALENSQPLYNDYRIVLPNGEARWIMSIGNTVRDECNQAIRMSGLCFDITENKQTQDRLVHSEELLRKTQSLAKIGSWQLDLSNHQLIWSDETYRIFGVPPGSAMNYERFLELAYPEDRTKVDDAWQKALNGGTYFVQHRIVVNGEIRWVEECAQFERDTQNNLAFGTGSVQDITERKNHEAQQTNMLRQLKEKELSKTRFLAAAGHDLRQPVAAANLFLDSLKLCEPTPQQSKLIEQLDQSMKVFSNQLSRLLDISKFDAGLVKPEIQPFDLGEVFNWLEQNFSQSAHEKNLRFRFRIPDNRALIVHTDIGLLESVLMNLVTNAIKFTAHGGILIAARPRGDNVLVQVWDTGIGIDRTDLPHIFEEFFQVDNPQRNRNAGLGLGLSISQRAMALLESGIVCRSHPGRGSVFEFSLPLNGEQREIKTQPNDQPARAHDQDLFAGKYVIILEDDELVAGAQISLLQGLNARPRHFPSAEEALAHPDALDADYFIVDYSLGRGLTGYEFLRMLQQKRQAPIRAIILTGETSSNFVSLLSDCPWPILHKPANLHQIVSALNTQ